MIQDPCALLNPISSRKFIEALCAILIVTKGKSGDVLTELKARRYSIRRCSDVLTEGKRTTLKSYLVSKLSLKSCIFLKLHIALKAISLLPMYINL